MGSSNASYHMEISYSTEISSTKFLEELLARLNVFLVWSSLTWISLIWINESMLRLWLGKRLTFAWDMPPGALMLDLEFGILFSLGWIQAVPHSFGFRQGPNFLNLLVFRLIIENSWKPQLLHWQSHTEQEPYWTMTTESWTSFQYSTIWRKGNYQHAQL